MENTERERGREERRSETQSVSQLHLEKFWQILCRHFFIFLTITSICVITAVSLHYLTPSYRTKATLMLQAAINNPLQSLSARLGGFSGFDVDGREVDRYLNQLRIHSFYERVANDVMGDPFLGEQDVSELATAKKMRILGRRKSSQKIKDVDANTLANLLQGMVAYSKDGIDAFSIHVQASSPELVFQLTNLLARSAVNALIEYEVQDLEESERYLKIQATKSQEAIQRTEASIASYKRGKNNDSVNQNFDEATVRSTEIKRLMAETQVQIDQNLAEIDSFGNSGRSLAQEPFDYKFGIRRKMDALHRYDETLQARKASLQRQLGDLQENFEDNAEQELAELKKSLDLESSLHQELKKHDFQMEMRRISAKNKFHLLEPSRRDVVQPSESLIAKLLVSLIAGLGISSLAAFFVESANPLVSSRSCARDAGLILLGSLPYGHARKRFRFMLANRSLKPRGPINAQMDQKINSAAMQICVRILDAKERARPSTSGSLITVTSTEPGEGKTFTSERIARGLAICDYKVLLVDGDLRAPALTAQNKSFGKDGLCEVIGKRENFGNARIAKMAEGLDFLPAGMSRSDPTHLLASKEFIHLLNDLRAIYDFIVIDSSPLSVSGDAAIIAKTSEFPVVVIALQETKLRLLHASVENLWGLTEGDLYAVLNKVPASQQYGYASYGRPGYGSLLKIKPAAREARLSQ